MFSLYSFKRFTYESVARKFNIQSGLNRDAIVQRLLLLLHDSDQMLSRYDKNFIGYCLKKLDPERKTGQFNQVQEKINLEIIEKQYSFISFLDAIMEKKQSMRNFVNSIETKYQVFSIMFSQQLDANDCRVKLSEILILINAGYRLEIPLPEFQQVYLKAKEGTSKKKFIQLLFLEVGKLEVLRRQVIKIYGEIFSDQIAITSIGSSMTNLVMTDDEFKACQKIFWEIFSFNLNKQIEYLENSRVRLNFIFDKEHWILQVFLFFILKLSGRTR